MRTVITGMIFSVILFISGHCNDLKTKDLGRSHKIKNERHSTDIVTAFRVRSDFHSELDDNHNWKAAINEAPSQTVDAPFRIRFEVESDSTGYRRQYSLQYRWNDRPWTYMEAQEFPYPSAATPPASIVGCEAFFYGEEAENLISVSKLPGNPGAGIRLAPTTPGWIPEPKSGASAEWEWAVVVRRWSDGPKLVKDGDRFAMRMVDHLGQPLPGPVPEFTVRVPSGHLGGTFVETPAHIGPFENNQGHLYFIMEPTETDNRFMMVKSMDNGKSWFEVDPNNRPHANDLEGVGAVMSNDGIIHMVHQKSEEVYYHSFATAISSASELSDQWITDSYVIARTEKPPVQTTDITLRPDGSLVVVYGAGTRLQYNIREPDGTWRPSRFVDSANPNDLTSPSLICRPDGVVDLAYKSADGKGWCRQLMANNILTAPQMFSNDLGTSERESIAILPLAYAHGSKSTLVVFRQSDGYLYGSFKSPDNMCSKPFRISDRPVVTNAVDSDQAGADVVIFDDKICVVFIAQDSRDLYFTMMEDPQTVPSATRIVSGIHGSWVRGKILKKHPISPCYGIIYDAGSKGGSGYNKFIAHPLPQE
jgi:hypothetical protein